MEPAFQTHIRTVYLCTALCKLVAAIGASVCLFIRFKTTVGIVSSLAGLGFILALVNTPDDGKNLKIRMSYLLSIAFFCGAALSPALDVTISLDPAVNSADFIGCTLVFICFTFASMLSNQLRYICLGGTLMSILSCMVTIGVLNMFVEIYLIYKVLIFIGLFILCTCITYWSYIIMEKRYNGDKDYVWHSYCLFLDIFLIIWNKLVNLMDKASTKKKK